MLAAHDAAISTVCVSDDFSIVVSGALDHTCIIWDLNRLRFIRSLKTPGPVQLVTISQINGDICSVSQIESVFRKSGSTLCLANVNGEPLATATTNETILSILFTCGTEGL